MLGMTRIVAPADTRFNNELRKVIDMSKLDGTTLKFDGTVSKFDGTFRQKRFVKLQSVN
jgi:hypothetical protein